MTSVCFYFQVHQPYRIKPYTVFQIGRDHEYFNHNASGSKLNNREIFLKVASKSYIPATRLWHALIHRHPELRIAYSFSGVVLKQFEDWAPEVLDLIRDMIATGRVEILAETYAHTLASLCSPEEFKRQCREHAKIVNRLFGVRPTVFRNTELIYTNDIARAVSELGFRGMLMEGADRVLGWRSPNFVYRSASQPKLKLLLKNYQLSDDVAFRFTRQDWVGWPLTAEKFASWIAAVARDGCHTVNLFMDYETFGEHQWDSSGIFDFLNRLPEELLRYPELAFATPSEVLRAHEPVGEIDAPHPVSWADTERDVTAWLGNELQHSASKALYDMEEEVLTTRNRRFIDTWRLLQTSDHFYYMCTKWFSDGDVHAYFNPYDSPYDAYISYMNVLRDFQDEVGSKLKNQKP